MVPMPKVATTPERQTGCGFTHSPVHALLRPAPFDNEIIEKLVVMNITLPFQPSTNPGKVKVAMYTLLVNTI